MGDIYNKAGDNDTFITAPASPAKTMTKTELGGAVAPCNYTGTGLKGTPNCPKKLILSI